MIRSSTGQVIYENKEVPYDQKVATAEEERRKKSTSKQSATSFLDGGTLDSLVLDS